MPAQDEYEVRVYDTKRGRRLVAAVEIVSPSNKDRPEHRQIFIAKCLVLLRNQVCVAVVDLVTTRNFNLYAASSRPKKAGDSWLLEGWAHALAPGQPLPTLPLWLADNFAVPLDLEASYEETCCILRIA